ncbi:hypothetical protein [Amycolatopsis anabasis]|uniref:hypothetical protein n=1 Tax=Amycolatopsis anabasis TaxID=1840409 RepID=UPI00131E4C2A|nr:hypothetical protein [Amycolatopsis anabasis]
MLAFPGFIQQFKPPIEQTDCGTLDLGCEAGAAARNWFTDLTLSITKGTAELMAEAMTFWTKSDRTSMLKSPAITDIQGLLMYIGLVLLVGSVIWQGIILVYKRKIDPLVNTGLGLLSFFGWSTVGTTAAVLLYEGGLALSAQVLDESIEKFSNTMATAMQANVVMSVATVFFLAIIMFFLAAIQWVLGFFRMGALVILLALLPTAAAGQINESTKPWLQKVLSWSLSLIMYQPIAAIIFAVGFTLIGDGRDIGTVLTGMAVLAMAVIAMPTMLRFFDWGGQRFVGGGGGGGGAMAAGAAASMLGGAADISRLMERSGPAGPDSGGGAGPPPVEAANTGDGPGSDTGEGAGVRPGGQDSTPNSGQPGQAAGDDATPTSAATGAEQGAGTAATSAQAGAGAEAAAGAGAGAAGPYGAVAGAALEAGNKTKQALGDSMTDGSGGGSGNG